MQTRGRHYHGKQVQTKYSGHQCGRSNQLVVPLLQTVLEKIIQVGVSRRCPSCRTPDEHNMYKLKVSVTDVEPNADNVPITGHLTFLGESGEALAGKEADLLAPLTKCRPNYVPAAISAIVGKKCAVIAEVDQETYDADHRIVFLPTLALQ